MFLSSKLSHLPHIRHGFLTKQYNIGARTKHEYDNLQKIKTMFHANDIITLNQTHSSLVHVVDQPIGRLTGDALITQKSGVLLCVRTADCAPILIAHKTQPIIAAIHAGWKGSVLEKIIENTAQLLKKADDLKNYVVAVGPCLHQASFQVGPAIYNNVANKKYFGLGPSPKAQDGALHRFDFPLFVHDKLYALGFKNIDVIDVNTYTSADLFSFRKATHEKSDNTGRQASVITLI